MTNTIDELEKLLAITDATDKVLDLQEKQAEAIQDCLNAVENYRQWLEQMSKEFKL